MEYWSFHFQVVTDRQKNTQYIIGHSLGALLAFELAQIVENELQGVFLEEPGWLDEFPDIKDFGPNPFIIQNKSKWKTPIDAINNYKELDPEGFNHYLDPFRYGMPPHAGWGLGLDRLMTVLIGIDNVREVVLYPRDPDRLKP